MSETSSPPPRLFRDNTLRDILAILWRRRILILGVVILFTAIGAIYVGNLAPKYTATVTVMVDARAARLVKSQSSLEDMRMSRQTLQGEVEVVRSRSLAGRVVDELGLVHNPHFNRRLSAPAPFFNTLNPIQLVRKLYRKLVPAPEVEDIDPAKQEALTRRHVIDALIGSLDIKQAPLSPVMYISVTTGAADTSAYVANTIANAYVLSQLDAKYEATKQATDWLSKRLDGLRKKVIDSENAVAAFRAENNLVSVRGTKLTEEKLGELNTQYILAQTARAEAQARYDHARRLMSSKGRLDTAAQALDSKLLEHLLAQEADLQRKVAELDERYGERHPKIINARSELADIRGKINTEVNKIVEVLRNQLDVARSREHTLSQALDVARGEAADEGSANVTLRQLEREAEANRLLYENFLARFKETSQQEDIQQADARILSEAVPPETPSKPRKGLILLLIVIGAGTFAVVLVLVLEQIDVGLRSAEDVEELTNLPVLAMVPSVKPAGGTHGVHRYVLDDPISAATEAVRNLYTSLRMGDGDHPPKLVCLTSTLSGEGKSTLSIWLARIAAMQGRRTVLLDCDLRRARLHEVLQLDNTRSLAELVSGDHTLDEVVQVDPDSGLHVIPGKVLHGNALAMLNSDAFNDVLKRLQQEYDLVLIDAPPILAVSDARVLANRADACIYLVRWNATDRNAVHAALKQLRGTDANLIGIAVTQVDTRKHMRYGYGDSGHYYGRYKGYYHEQS